MRPIRYNLYAIIGWLRRHLYRKLRYDLHCGLEGGHVRKHSQIGRRQRDFTGDVIAVLLRLICSIRAANACGTEPQMRKLM